MWDKTFHQEKFLSPELRYCSWNPPCTCKGAIFNKSCQPFTRGWYTNSINPSIFTPKTAVVVCSDTYSVYIVPLSPRLPKHFRSADGSLTGTSKSFWLTQKKHVGYNLFFIMLFWWVIGKPGCSSHEVISPCSFKYTWSIWQNTYYVSCKVRILEAVNLHLH